MKPELLAVRAVNQYRRRDILAYLGLRYYLENQCSRGDLWARDVSTHLVSTRKSAVYFRSYHFKEIDGDSIEHRSIFVPGPNEAVAETSLLYECSKYSAFRSLPNVYSYRFPNLDSKEGVFQTYFPGFRGRHKSIANACKTLDGAIVRYTDVRKFYPSISGELATKKWRSACDSSNITAVYRGIGENLLADHSKTATAYNEGLGILIGPMFSHLIANLILANVDKVMVEKMGEKYWRYVDDIVLVGDVNQVKDGRELLNSMLTDMGFRLHEEGKDFEVNTGTWLDGAQDFDGSDGKVWIGLIANIKRFLIAKPNERIDLLRAFSENEINIPILDYSSIVMESSYIERLSDWLGGYSWSKKTVRALTVSKLVDDAIQARQFYWDKMKALLDENPMVQGYARKRTIPKLRFFAGRLFFLATPEILSFVSSALVAYPELLLQSKVLNAILYRDISSLLELGANAIQAAAQILRIQNRPVNCTLSTFGEIELQGIAILRLNGITINFTEDVRNQTDTNLINQFALGVNQIELMRADDPFIKEIASLRGVENPLRHEDFLDTAFDKDEHMIFDVIHQLQPYGYY